MYTNPRLIRVIPEAYHGDTVNTAARIQGLCNELDQRLLISHFVLDSLPKSNPYGIEEKGTFALKGKETVVKVYSVNRSAVQR